MSQPNEPRFEDDFDCDIDPPEPPEWSFEKITIEDIAISKAHIYSVEYNPSTGVVRDKPNYHALKEGYKAGFLEGFAYRLTEPTPDKGE